MTTAGVVLVDLASVAILFWILNLVRRDRLYVGYGVLFVGVLLATMVAVSVPPLTRLLSAGLAVFFPAGGPAVLGFAFVLLLLVYILTQTSILSNRVAALVQDLALSQARARPGSDSKPESLAGVRESPGGKEDASRTQAQEIPHHDAGGRVGRALLP
jgi:hypothetical protein